MTVAGRRHFIDDATFYLSVYPDVRSTLNRFVQAVRHLRLDPDLASEGLSLIQASGGLLSDAFKVCGADAAEPAVTTDRFAEELSRFRAILRDIDDAAAVACERELKVHAEYFEGLRSLWTAETAPGARTPAERDFLINSISVISSSVFDRYKWRSADPRTATAFFDAQRAEETASDFAKALIAASANTLTGWCSRDKALMLHSLVRDLRPRQAVEIGIYGGRSLIPVAAALKENKFGEVFGIETWSAAAIAQFQTSIKNDLAWALADYAEIKRSFLRFVLDHQLHDVVRIVEAPSSRAHLLIDEVQFLHIDGGHSTFGAAQDIVNFVPKVTAGGLIVFDDIDWASTGPGLELLMDTCRLLHVVATIDDPAVPGCCVFQKI